MQKVTWPVTYYTQTHEAQQNNIFFRYWYAVVAEVNSAKTHLCMYNLVVVVLQFFKFFLSNVCSVELFHIQLVISLLTT